MNILFVNYGDFTTNSLNHIGGFANVLTAGGHACIVAVPGNRESISTLADPLFIPASYADLLARPALFPDGRAADLIHAWTPREGVRKFVVAYQRVLPRAVPLLIHLEDNEEHLICAYARRSMAELRALTAKKLDEILLDILPDPVRHRTFLHLADAATVIVDRLKEKVPATVPAHLVAPGVDAELYRPQAPDPAFRAELGIGEDERVVAFTGSNTFANEPEMRELYVAVRLLNRQGLKTRLVRTGFNRAEFLESLTPDITAHVLDLGFVPKATLPKLLALADVLVQPGRPGPFNDLRLPSKLPEFLASGRAVILPPTNVALSMTDGVEALFLSSGTPEDIADKCAKVFADPALAARLGKAGAAFARRHFDLRARTEALFRIYQGLAAQPARAAWDSIRGSSASDLTAAAAVLAEGLDQGAGLGPVARKDIAALASDLSIVSRIEEERAELATHRKLESADAELRRNYLETQAHAHNIEGLLVDKRRQLKLTRQLSGQHIKNLEGVIAGQNQHLKNLEGTSAAQVQHIKNLEGELKARQSRLNETLGRINEIERTTREQIDTAVKEHQKLAVRISEMDAELTERDRRVREMVSSRSWKLTAPVRDLERLFGRRARGT